MTSTSKNPSPSDGESSLVVLLDQRMTGAETRRFAGGQAAVFSNMAPGKEGANEDGAALLMLDAVRGVLAVADGAGGLPSGARASAVALQGLRDAIAAVGDGDATLRGAILDGFEQANRAVLDLGVGAATTLAAVELNGPTVRPYHAGDSTILVTGQRGKRKMMTLAHSPVSYAVEAGAVSSREALHHDDLHVVSNIVGSSEMRIDVGPTLRLAPHDTLVLGTDGLFDNLHAHEIVDYVRKGALAAAAQQLADSCMERMAHPRADAPGKPDDLTFVLYRRTAMGRRRGATTARSSIPEASITAGAD